MHGGVHLQSQLSGGRSWCISWVHSQPSLCDEFQDSQNYIQRPVSSCSSPKKEMFVHNSNEFVDVSGFFWFFWKSAVHILSPRVSLGTMKAVRWVPWWRPLSVKLVPCNDKGERGGSEMVSVFGCTREKGRHSAGHSQLTDWQRCHYSWCIAFFQIWRFSGLFCTWNLACASGGTMPSHYGNPKAPHMRFLFLLFLRKIWWLMCF